MSPDDHFQDLKRLIQAASGKAHRINVIMPLLYGGRQHRRSYRESLDCAFALQELQNMGIRVVMLTGDNERTARAVARQAGLDDADVAAGLLPAEKAERIRQLQAEGLLVAMVGDGINDAPALARADVGFAMAGNGTDTAIETADVALMDDDLRKIPRFIRLSRATFAILVQNITLALGVKALFFALTFTGHATMWMAVFADVGTALLVVANGLAKAKAVKAVVSGPVTPECPGSILQMLSLIHI